MGSFCKCKLDDIYLNWNFHIFCGFFEEKCCISHWIYMTRYRTVLDKFCLVLIWWEFLNLFHFLIFFSLRICVCVCGCFFYLCIMFISQNTLIRNSEKCQIKIWASLYEALDRNQTSPFKVAWLILREAPFAHSILIVSSTILYISKPFLFCFSLKINPYIFLH